MDWWKKKQQQPQGRDWKFSPVKALPLTRFLSDEPDWVTGKNWTECGPELGKLSWRGTAPQRETGLQVSFPLKIGMGFGTEGTNSSCLALRILQIKSGSDISFQTEDSAWTYDLMRQKRHSLELRRKVETAGNVVSAASVLMLSQAFCGPVVSLAMTGMATWKFIGFAIRHILNLVSKGQDAQNQLGGGLPAPLYEFSTASLLLSIGVPILKLLSPEIHHTFECLGAAIPVALGYAQTTSKVKRAPVGSDVGEKLWRQRHRWAARRLCGYLSDFQHPPTFGWLVDTWEKSTVTILSNRFSDRTWVIVSIPLPDRLVSKQHASKKVISLKDKIVIKKASNADTTTEGLDIQRIYHRHSLEEEVNGQQMVPEWGERSNNMYLEFSAVQSGWRWLQQRSSLVLRGCYLMLVFGPLILFGPVIYFLSNIIVLSWGLKLRNVLWWLLRFCLERGGAAFIKWGQWSATREDLFPEDLCHYLGRLHDRAPEHSYRETKKAVLRNLGRSVEDIFEDFPKKPWASGSIAQVYKAKLKDCREGMPTEVAVKVRHPSVALRIYQDFQIMAALANFAQELPALRWLKLRESVDQFSHTLTAQADLRVEAENLARFHQNFETLDQIIIFPKLIPDLVLHMAQSKDSYIHPAMLPESRENCKVSEEVIVESFERGQALSKFLGNRTALNTQSPPHVVSPDFLSNLAVASTRPSIAAAGVDTYLKMLLTDNFVHTDLHPGNILARCADDGQNIQQLQLVLLDFGLAEELTPTVRYHFLSFIIMIGVGNGERAANHLLQFSWPHDQTCRTPQLLVEDMKYLFTQECNLQCRQIDLNKVLIKVLQLCRKHEVTIDSAYASLVVAVCVLVGFARSLDPELSIMDAAVPCLFFYNLTGRIMGGIYG